MKRKWINVPSVLVDELHCLNEKGKQMKSIINAEERETNALMQTVKAYRDNLKLTERELYAMHKRKDNKTSDLDELKEKLRKKEMQLEKVNRIDIGTTKETGFSIMEYFVYD